MEESKTMNQKITRLREIKDKREKLAKEDKELEAEYDALEIELGEDLIAAELAQVKVDGVGTVKPANKIKTWIIDKDKLVAYLKETNQIGIIEPDYIGWQRLLGWAKEKYEAEKDEGLKKIPGMGYSIKTIAALRRS